MERSVGRTRRKNVEQGSLTTSSLPEQRWVPELVRVRLPEDSGRKQATGKLPGGKEQQIRERRLGRSEGVVVEKAGDGDAQADRRVQFAARHGADGEAASSVARTDRQAEEVVLLRPPAWRRHHRRACEHR